MKLVFRLNLKIYIVQQIYISAVGLGSIGPSIYYFNISSDYSGYVGFMKQNILKQAWIYSLIVYLKLRPPISIAKHLAIVSGKRYTISASKCFTKIKPKI